jgi:chromosome partitioning protein
MADGGGGREERFGIEDLSNCVLAATKIQQNIIEFQAEPLQEKQLRRFSLPEAGAIIGITERHLRDVIKRDGMPIGTVVGGNNRRAFTLGEINQIRRALAAAAIDERRYSPVRDPAKEPLQVITFANFKGGAAKTTSAVHFAKYMALRGYRVLAIDLDSQASLTSLFGCQPDLHIAEKETLYPFFRSESNLSNLIRQTYWDGLDLIPANLALYNSEFELPLRFGDDHSFRFWRLLEDGLGEVADRYDVVVCDCPPSLGYITMNGVFAATGLVIPMPPSMIDFASTAQFMKMLIDTTSELARHEGREGKSFDFLRVLATKFEPADLNHGQMFAFMSAAFGKVVMTNRMARTAMLDLAGIQKETLYEAAPGSGNRKTYERGLEYMNAVNREIEEIMLRTWRRAGEQGGVG